MQPKLLVNFASHCGPDYKLLLVNLIDKIVRNFVLVLEPKVKRTVFPAIAYHRGVDRVVGTQA